MDIIGVFVLSFVIEEVSYEVTVVVVEETSLEGACVGWSVGGSTVEEDTCLSGGSRIR